jgi:hypothetical protein
MSCYGQVFQTRKEGRLASLIMYVPLQYHECVWPASCESIRMTRVIAHSALPCGEACSLAFQTGI